MLATEEHFAVDQINGRTRQTTLAKPEPTGIGRRRIRVPAIVTQNEALRVRIGTSSVKGRQSIATPSDRAMARVGSIARYA